MIDFGVFEKPVMEILTFSQLLCMRTRLRFRLTFITFCKVLESIVSSKFNLCDLENINKIKNAVTLDSILSRFSSYMALTNIYFKFTLWVVSILYGIDVGFPHPISTSSMKIFRYIFIYYLTFFQRAVQKAPQPLPRLHKVKFSFD